jgi:hypothetical protein
MLNDAESDFREVKFADHSVTNCGRLAMHGSQFRERLTLAKSHVSALDLGAGVAWVRHVIHKDIDVSARLSKIAINELEHKKTRFCQSSAPATSKEGIRIWV